MEQAGFQEILKALELHSKHMDRKLEHMEGRLNSRIDKVENSVNRRIDELENSLNSRMDKMEIKMENRFDRFEKKFDGLSVSLIETQETVDYLASKSLQHEKKLRNLPI